jgi:O-antigen ligase
MGDDRPVASADVRGTVTGVLLGLAVLVVAAGYDPRLFAANWVPRVALVYPLVALIALVWLGARRPALGLRVDLLDLTVGAFCLWQVVAALAAPVPLLAWFGAYNRLGGAVWWLAMGALLVVARRAFARRATLDTFVWVVSVTVVLAAAVALVQAFGGEAWWERGPFTIGRMPGPTGNPVSLGGLGLLAVLLGALALTPGTLGRVTRWAAIVGAAAGLTAVVLSVSRAAYLGLLVGGITLAVVWGAGRRRRALAWLAAALAVTALATLLYAPGGVRAPLLRRISAQAEREGAVAGQIDPKRVAYWGVALRAARERPLAGYGPGAYVVAYRRFVPADVIQKDPASAVTDPHGIIFLFAAGSGVVGLLLALGLVGVCGFVAVRSGLDGRGGGAPRAGPATGRPVAAAGAFALAALAFLCLSPAEPAVVLSLFVVAGLGCAPGTVPARLCWTSSRRVAVAAWAVVFAATAAAGIGAAYLGIALWRADTAYRVAVDRGDLAMAETAADRSPLMPAYQILAGKLALQAAFEPGGGAQLVADGRNRLRRALALDETDPLPRVDLAKLALQQGDVDAAIAEVRAGLEQSPRHPVLQAVWGYAVVTAARGGAGTDEADALRRGLEAYPDKVADASYWLSLAAAARGDEEAAAAAAAEARRLAPDLTPDDYERRLRGGD